MHIYRKYNLKTDPRITKDIDTLIIAAGTDQRAYESIRILNDRGIKIKDVLVFDFEERRQNLNSKKQINKYEEYERLKVKYTPFKSKLYDVYGAREQIKEGMNVALDISCFTKPYFFVLFQNIIEKIKQEVVSIYYTEPTSYRFERGRFEKYAYSVGSLEIKPMPGFPGRREKSYKKLLIVLLGFDGRVSQYLVEDQEIKEKIIINGFPSYAHKFKEISLINN